LDQLFEHALLTNFIKNRNSKIFRARKNIQDFSHENRIIHPGQIRFIGIISKQLKAMQKHLT